MSYYNSNITGSYGGGSGASGIVTKFEKTVTISSNALAKITIDISSDISNYADITNDRIIVELNNASAIAAGDAELSHTYDAETGVITITSTNSKIPFASNSAVELKLNVYVAGAVQMPPAPVLPTAEGYEVSAAYASRGESYDKPQYINLLNNTIVDKNIETVTILGTPDEIIICAYANRAVEKEDIGAPYGSIANASPMILGEQDYSLATGSNANKEAMGTTTFAIFKSADNLNPFSVTAHKAGNNWDSSYICKLSPKK